MNRRDFLNGLGRRATAVGAISAAAAAGAYASGREFVDRSSESLHDQVKALIKRMDDMDAEYKKTVKVLIALTGLSLGIDLASWL